MEKKNNYPQFRHTRTAELDKKLRGVDKGLTTFERCEEILKDLNQIFPELRPDWQQVTRWMAICRRVYEAKLKAEKTGEKPFLYHGRRGKHNWHRIRALSPAEKICYSYLQKKWAQHYSISTIYRWFVSHRLSPDILDAYQKSEVSLPQALERQKMRLGKHSRVNEARQIIDMTTEILERVASVIEASGCDSYLKEIEQMCGVY